MDRAEIFYNKLYLIQQMKTYTSDREPFKIVISCQEREEKGKSTKRKKNFN